MIKRMLRPKTAKPTTFIPIIEPPANAILRAGAKPVRAAWVVRTLAFVAAIIPKYPAKAEAIAPVTNETAINQEESSLPEFENPSNIATAITKIASTLYSVFKKAIAPSWICFEIVIIFSVPELCLEIQRLFKNEYINAAKPNIGIM